MPKLSFLFLGLIFAFITTLLLPSVVLAEISYIGPGLKIQDNNSNVRIDRLGNTDRIVHYGVRVPESGNIVSFRTYFQQNPGYSSGTGGLIRVRIWPEDGGSPARPDRSGAPTRQQRLQ